MNCLIITGGAFPEKDKAMPLIEKILGERKNYFAIAADSGLFCADLYGIVPDIILGDMDSITESHPNLLSKYKNIESLKFIRDKDYPDTELALRKAAELKSGKTVLLGGSGGRQDHLFSIERFFEKEYGPDIWLGEKSIVFSMSESRFPYFCWNDFFSGKEIQDYSAADFGSEKEIPSSLMISVFPVRFFEGKLTGNFEIEDKGLFWPLKSVDWKSGEYSLSNRPSFKGKAELKIKKGRFLAIVNL